MTADRPPEAAFEKARPGAFRALAAGGAAWATALAVGGACGSLWIVAALGTDAASGGIAPAELPKAFLLLVLTFSLPLIVPVAAGAAVWLAMGRVPVRGAALLGALLTGAAYWRAELWPLVFLSGGAAGWASAAVAAHILNAGAPRIEGRN